MGETYRIPSCTFNRSIRFETRTDRLTGETGALLLRETAEMLGFLDLLEEAVVDPRDPRYVVHPWRELLATGLLLPAMGWRDQDDADKLRDDPALRLAVSTRASTSPLEPSRDTRGRQPDGLASQPTLSRLMAALATEDNRLGLREAMIHLAGRQIQAANRGHRPRYITIDVDLLPCEVHGHQVGARYHGYYRKTVYLPIVASIAETGQMIDVVLREGRNPKAEESMDFILPLLDRVERHICQVASVRVDAAFPSEHLLAGLENRDRPVAYVSRLRNNKVLDQMAAPYLKLPPAETGQEPRTVLHEMTYRAGPWSRHRRVVLVVQERPGELFPHHFWLVTSWRPDQVDARGLLEIYRQRGTAEGHMGELMDVLNPALSSVARPKKHIRGNPIQNRTPSRDGFAVNEAILLMSALAYNLMHATRLLLVRGTRQRWSLRRMREMVLRIPARLLLHGRRIHVVVGRIAAPLWCVICDQLLAFNPAFVT